MENLIGKVFKLIRNSKQLSLRQVAGGYISAGQLSRFERDESHLSIDAFLNSLNRLNVSLEEFHYTYNLYHQIDDVRFSEDLSEAYLSRNLVKLKKFLEYYKYQIDGAKDALEFQTAKLNYIVIKAIISYCNNDISVTNQEITYIMDYLFSVDEWGRYELWIFTNSSGILSIESLDTFASEMIKRTQLYYSIPTNRRKIHQLLLNVINISISQNRNDIAIKYITHLEKLNILETDIYEKVLFKYNKAYYSYNNGNKSSLHEMKQCVEFLNFVDCEKISSFLENEISNLES